MIDWVRVYWNVHTDGGASHPSFWSMLDWVNSASAWDKLHPYNNLNSAAQVFSDVQLRTNWNAARDYTANNAGHGINHPGP